MLTALVRAASSGPSSDTSSSSSTTLSPGATTTANHPALSGQALDVVIWGLIVLLLLVLLITPLLSYLYNRRPAAQENSHAAAKSGHENYPSFFQIPFITWYLLHFTVAALVIVAIVLLGVDGVVDASVISALLGSLLGYVLGSSSRSNQTSPPPQTGTGKTTARPARRPPVRRK